MQEDKKALTDAYDSVSEEQFEKMILENGKVKAQGKHQELMESVDTYKSLFLENETSEI